ncbi:Uncharacterised protein [Vibrio cholerae]|nr:Uncharacterised protein [Vibrio cholerae]
MSPGQKRIKQEGYKWRINSLFLLLSSQPRLPC